ncbi:transmembrane protein 85 [Rhizophagus irregularis]|uniref:ER membrane protein complex subunit 4 n=1 Tax=Rhizophagus irregularis TaxID=588596 RepID=A0A2N0PH03_9GLOM|nr:transmembrane protein 85 [Rhizophagus irregularis]
MSNKSNKWRIDFTNLSDQARRYEIRGQTYVVDAPPPPGFGASVPAITSSSKGNLKNRKDAQQVSTEKDQETLKIKKAWDAALSPGKNIPMNAFMLWMSGNGVQIFSVMIKGMLFFQPIKALMGIDSVFERYESSKTKSQLIWPKLVYVILQLLTMALGLYKCSSMGLLPTATSDWLAFMEQKQILEYSAT